jgi:polyisoprenyl-phosphate glycosyltransferase
MPTRPASRRPDDPFVSIVLPVFNEDAVLPRLRDAVEQALAECGVRYEIVFVDDGSTDGSADRLDAFAAGDHHVRVLHFSRNFGHQAAVQAGLEHARGDVVVVMDSDLQDDPRAIVAFLEEWRAGYDVVYAIRQHRKEGRVKRALFDGFYRLLSAVSEVPIPRDAGNFGLVDRRVVAAMLRLGDADRFYPGLRSWVGFRQTGVPVERHARYDLTPRVSLLGLFRLAKSAILSFSRAPLTAFYLIAAAAGFVTFGCLGIAFGAWLFGSTSPGGLGLVGVAAWLSCLNALGIAVVGEYLARVHDVTRNRPRYVLDESPKSTEDRGPRTRRLTVLESLEAIYNDDAATGDTAREPLGASILGE